jgi:hypothetical protein
MAEEIKMLKGLLQPAQVMNATCCHYCAIEAECKGNEKFEPCEFSAVECVEKKIPCTAECKDFKKKTDDTNKLVDTSLDNARIQK